jgi:uncharacterized protein YlxP (DUF503 family)
MVIGVLQFELLIHGAESLKDKRRVVNSVKDRFHRDHLVSIAEVASLDNPSVAILGLALVGREGKHVGEVLDKLTSKLRQLPDAELGDTARQILYGASAPDGNKEGQLELPTDGAGGTHEIPPRAGLHEDPHAVDDEMLRRAREVDTSPELPPFTSGFGPGFGSDRPNA